MEKSTINRSFSIAMLVHQRVFIIQIDLGRTNMSNPPWWECPCSFHPFSLPKGVHPQPMMCGLAVGQALLVLLYNDTRCHGNTRVPAAAPHEGPLEQLEWSEWSPFHTHDPSGHHGLNLCVLMQCLVAWKSQTHRNTISIRAWVGSWFLADLFLVWHGQNWDTRHVCLRQLLAWIHPHAARQNWDRIPILGDGHQSSSIHNIIGIYMPWYNIYIYTPIVSNCKDSPYGLDDRKPCTGTVFWQWHMYALGTRL